MSSPKTGKRIEVRTDSDNAIEVKHLSKSFHLPTERSWGLKQAIFNRLKGIKGYKDQRVLRDISFNVKKGEFLGIVGRNGSGKSTLLKILSGIYYPSKGEIIVNGSLVPFIELGVGFNPELTGRENVYLNGALLGFSNKEMDAMYDEIVDFAELREFMDQKLKNYSSGMQVRLAFSIAIRAKGDILVLDEVLAVGDAAFQQKCNDYFAKLHKAKQTIILVTHDMNNVRKFCDRAILIEKGEIALDGEPELVSKSYIKLWSDFIPFINPRKMKNPKAAPIVDPYTGKTHDTLPAGSVVKYSTKVRVNGKDYYRTEKDSLKNLDRAIESTYLKEI
ncbi:ABC transporter ATP-binding protein [Candidatus Saccharibacteria bacterium]|nr:ABC transporter ATP-binding protein [Candidatus Saccharibacteria bacterium]